MKHLTASLVLFFISFLSFGQNAQIVYDFNKGAFVENEFVENGKIKPLVTGSFAVIKIININTFRWKAEIAGRSINYVTPIPSELQTIFRLPDQTASKQKAEEGLNNVTKSVEDMKALKKEVEEKEAADPAKAKTKKEAESTIAANAKNDKFEAAMEKLVKACEEYVTVARKMAGIKFNRVLLINLSKHKWEGFTAMEEKLPLEMSETDMRSNYDFFVTYYAKAYVLYRAAKDAATSDSEKKRISDAEEQIEDGHNNIYDDNFLKLIEDVLVLQEAMRNAGYFTVVSPPVQVDGDYVEFNIKTTPTKTNDLMPYEFGKEIPMEIPARGGAKVDFSVGPVVCFGKNAKDEKYYVEPTTKKDTVVFKQRDNNNAISPGLAAMMHIYPRSGKEIAYGGMFGVGVGFQNETDAILSLYAGVSVVMGKRQKIMLSGGVSYLRVDRLKNKEFITEKEYPVSKIDLPAITEKVFKPSIFLSISYNLTNRVVVK